MLLLAIGDLLGVENAYALGAKGHCMEHQGAGAMKEDSSVKKRDETMMKEQTPHHGAMQDTMQVDKDTMRKEEGMEANGRGKGSNMKEKMKQHLTTRAAYEDASIA